MNRRKNIYELSLSKRASLVAAIKKYIAMPGVVDWHKMNHDLHTSGYYFLTGHRQYIAGLEAFLRSVGQLGPAELLPKWDPSDSDPARRLIPPEFIDPPSGEGHIHNIWAPLRPIVAFSFFPFKGFWLRLWPPFPIPISGFMPWRSFFGFILCWSSHFAVHVLVGGLFGQIPATSKTPLFWLYHAGIDDLYWGWEQAHPMAEDTAGTDAMAEDPAGMTGGTGMAGGAGGMAGGAAGMAGGTGGMTGGTAGMTDH